LRVSRLPGQFRIDDSQSLVVTRFGNQFRDRFIHGTGASVRIDVGPFVAVRIPPGEQSADKTHVRLKSRERRALDGFVHDDRVNSDALEGGRFYNCHC
jgi:hypothetical protein